MSRFALFFFPCALGLIADLVTKSYMFANYFDPASATQPGHAARDPVWWIDGVLGIQTSTNPGALFGLGSGYSWLFAIFSFVALAGIIFWLIAFRAMADRWLTFALGMISGGILGNLYDRIGWGAAENFPESIRTNVRDWIYFRVEGVMFFDPWPNFNIADSLLVGGAMMLFVHAFFFADPGKGPAESGQDPDKN